jgi:hypothetical protein
MGDRIHPLPRCDPPLCRKASTSSWPHCTWPRGDRPSISAHRHRTVPDALPRRLSLYAMRNVVSGDQAKSGRAQKPAVAFTSVTGLEERVTLTGRSVAKRCAARHSFRVSVRANEHSAATPKGSRRPESRSLEGRRRATLFELPGAPLERRHSHPASWP